MPKTSLEKLMILNYKKIFNRKLENLNNIFGILITYFNTIVYLECRVSIRNEKQFFKVNFVKLLPYRKDYL